MVAYKVRMAVFKLQRWASAEVRHPLADTSPLKAHRAPPAVAFCGLLPELAVFEAPPDDGLASDATAASLADGSEAIAAAAQEAATAARAVAEW
jgi:hypothetical protein